VLSLVRGEDYEAVKLILGHEIDDVMQQYVQRAHQLQVLRRPRPELRPERRPDGPPEPAEGVAGE